MDLNTTIGVLAAVVVIVGSIYYLNMGGSVSSTSNAVKAKGDAKGETEKSKGDSKVRIKFSTMHISNLVCVHSCK